MRRKKTVVAVICLLGMITIGCGTAKGVVESAENSAVAVEKVPVVDAEVPETVTEAPITVTELPETEAPVVHSGSPVVGIEQPDDASGLSLDFANADSARITYTTNQNSAIYITSASELQAYDVEKLDTYDETFFREKALLLVKKTTNSGSARVGIQSVTKDGSAISVTLSYEAPEIGTTDTWLIWAEVEKGLEECQWKVSNPALESQLEKE